MNKIKMKPSERIKQIMGKLAKECGDSPFDHKIGAIWGYLDEQHEIDKKRRKELQDNLIDIN